MATKKDMRREELVVPYQEPAVKDTSIGDLTGAMSSTMPMAAMFTRNKFVGWAAVVVAIQNWLAESPQAKAAASQPAYMSVGMALLSLFVTYLPIFMPPPGAPKAPAPSQ